MARVCSHPSLGQIPFICSLEECYANPREGMGKTHLRAQTQ